MNAKYTPIYHGPQCQVIEHFATPAPDIAAPIFPLAFVIEAVYLGYLSRLMVSPNESNSIGIPYFEG
jgi:hypothetical protein